MLKKICQICKKEFNAKRKNTNFCSKKCCDVDFKIKHPEYMQCYRQEFAKKLRIYKENYRKEHPEYSEKTRKYNKDYREKNPLKIKAGNQANNKIKIKKNCEICGKKNDVQKHHPDYFKPLDVVFLCRKCHFQIHRKLKGGDLYVGKYKSSDREDESTKRDLPSLQERNSKS